MRPGSSSHRADMGRPRAHRRTQGPGPTPKAQGAAGPELGVSEVYLKSNRLLPYNIDIPIFMCIYTENKI